MDDEVHRTPGGRSEDTSPDPEMAEGGSIGRRPVVRDETGYAAGSSGKVRLGITSGQDTTDRVREVRRSGPEAAGRGKTRDLHLPGLYPLLWAMPQERNLHRMADYCEKANGCETQSHQG